MKHIVMIHALPVLDGSRCSVVSCGNESNSLPVQSCDFFPSDFFEELFVGYGLLSEDPFVVADELFQHLSSAGISVDVKSAPGSFIFQFDVPDASDK